MLVAVVITGGVSLTGCVSERPVVGDIAIQRQGDGIDIALCEDFRVDEIWVDAWHGKREPLWRAKPYVVVQRGDILSGAELDGTFTREDPIDFDATSELIVRVQNDSASLETDFPIRDGVPADRWLRADGTIAAEPCS